jgi:hypothetical protein
MTRGIREERLLHQLALANGMDNTEFARAYRWLLENECEELNQWKPIDENTPKDRPLLLFYPGYMQIVDFFDDTNKNIMPSHWQELPEDPE